MENADFEEIMFSARQIVEDITTKKTLSVELLDLRSYDDYTFRHSINVAVYAVAVAHYMGMSEEELNEIAQAGICHDLGKQKISIDIINKPGRLTDAEYEEVKKHPQYSFDVLRSNREIPQEVREAVLCHHENENGSGYPAGKEGSEVSLMTKIIHAVDVYDALISRRPYKEPYSSVEAFDYLMGGKDILFNEAVVDAMRMVIPTYPIATEIMLSTGESAVVVGHSADPMRPVVRIVGKDTDLDLSDAAHAEIFIVTGGREDAAYREVAQLNEDRQAVSTQKRTILIVDDSPVSLQTTSAFLSHDRYQINTLQSGLAAINYIKAKGAPDLIIMDIEMPTLDGVATVAGIREMGFQNLPIIFLTANKSKETVLKCIQVNAKDYIIKPVRPVYLRERVAIALGETQER